MTAPRYGLGESFIVDMMKSRASGIWKSPNRAWSWEERRSRAREEERRGEETGAKRPRAPGDCKAKWLRVHREEKLGKGENKSSPWEGEG